MLTDSELAAVSNFPAIAERFKRWRAALYDRVDFSLPASEWHTKAHCERVLLFALSIARARGASDADLETLSACAVFHDTRRLDDGLDVGHGARGAKNYADAMRAAGKPVDERAAIIMAYHDRDDEESEAAIEPRFGKRGVELYRVFKDADGLDRFRLGPGALDEKFLRTPESKALVKTARALART